MGRGGRVERVGTVGRLGRVGRIGRVGRVGRVARVGRVGRGGRVGVGVVHNRSRSRSVICHSMVVSSPILPLIRTHAFLIFGDFPTNQWG